MNSKDPGSPGSFFVIAQAGDPVIYSEITRNRRGAELNLSLWGEVGEQREPGEEQIKSLLVHTPLTQPSPHRGDGFYDRL